MREVNFSIPNANKASVGITTALYDRRALDCTSTLPLINSLNNLAYLTTSSGRIRDILTVDGGIERLVCILKRGRSRDMMEMWKWNLAFQCIVNIGVRGSEAVRTRVVEADMVPVIATILDNYFQVIEKVRELESRRKCPFSSGKLLSRSSTRNDSTESRSSRTRRNPPPPPIAIPAPRGVDDGDESASEITPTTSTANMSLSSPPERTSFLRQHSHHRSISGRAQLPSPTLSAARALPEPPATAFSLQQPGDAVTTPFGVRPVRNVDRLPSMMPTLHAELGSQPQSPTTPNGPPTRHPNSIHAIASASRPRRRPSIRHQLSMSGSDDDGQIEETPPEVSNGNGQPEPLVEIQADIVMQDIVVDDNGLLEPQTDAVVAVPDISSVDDETFNMTHRSAADRSLTIPTAPPAPDQLGFPANPLPPPVNPLNATPPNLQQSPAWLAQSRTVPVDRSSNIIAAMPRDEDVLMSLQLLAYVSKYCYLRSYFQQSHLVPRLKIGSDLQMLEPDYSPTAHTGPSQAELDDEWDNEFVKKPGEKPYNIFPLIEKFTAKHSSSRHHNHALTPTSAQQGDMQYWAGVVMRNLCRKDESRGGIRQCAYWKCGKWEEFTRQFAKCRRCRRTKYCSKECQKGAWGSHRFWCVAAEPGDGEAGTSERGGGANGSGAGGSSGHHHHHHHSNGGGSGSGSHRHGHRPTQSTSSSVASQHPASSSHSQHHHHHHHHHNSNHSGNGNPAAASASSSSSSSSSHHHPQRNQNGSHSHPLTTANQNPSSSHLSSSSSSSSQPPLQSPQ